MPEAKTEFVRPSKETEKEIKFGYCTEFIIMLENPLPDEEVYAFKDFLNESEIRSFSLQTMSWLRYTYIPTILEKQFQRR